MNRFERLLAGTLASVITCATAAQTAPINNPSAQAESVKHLPSFQTIELRRYTTTDGARERFAKYFDTYFPEAFEQLGAMVFGQFLERGNPNHFTWLRGYKDLSARPVVCAEFYYGPLWKEHRSKVNAILPDSDNVILLQPLHPEHGLLVLPAVDPVEEAKGAQGVVVMQIFPVKKGSEEAFAKQSEAAFARYRSDGVREAGVLISLDVPNNFPQLPIRTDGPWLVWVGVVKDSATLDAKVAPVMKAAEQSLAATGLLRGEIEHIVMDPTPRSRLRWLESGHPSP